MTYLHGLTCNHLPKKLLPVRTGLVAKSITSPDPGLIAFSITSPDRTGGKVYYQSGPAEMCYCAHGGGVCGNGGGVPSPVSK